jgi:SAM-dependent methyltransferase
MPFSIEQWHARFTQQSKWTAPLRAFLFDQINAPSAQNILEVGCGTGAVTKSPHDLTSAKIFGADLLWDRVNFAKNADPKTTFSCANALALPFTSHQFDITFCHYFLLWMNEQAESALLEMARVTRPGGIVLALAEPAYSARIDYPSELARLGQLQTQSLARQGASIDMGIRLAELFSRAGLVNLKYGLSGFQNNIKVLPEWFESEWETIASDLQCDLSPDEIARLKTVDQQAWLEGSRVLHIPTFYTLGMVK